MLVDAGLKLFILIGKGSYHIMALRERPVIAHPEAPLRYGVDVDTVSIGRKTFRRNEVALWLLICKAAQLLVNLPIFGSAKPKARLAEKIGQLAHYERKPLRLELRAQRADYSCQTFAIRAEPAVVCVTLTLMPEDADELGILEREARFAHRVAEELALGRSIVDGASALGTGDETDLLPGMVLAPQRRERTRRANPGNGPV